MSRTDAIDVLADWLHEHRGPPSCTSPAGRWYYVLLAVATPGGDALSDFSARATKEVDALWPVAPEVLRDLMWAAGMVPHGPPMPPRGAFVRARTLINRDAPTLSLRVIAEADGLWPEEP